MPINVRLTKKEQKDLREKCIEINKLLVKRGLQPLRDSELLHKILEKTIRYVRVEKDGRIVIEE